MHDVENDEPRNARENVEQLVYDDSGDYNASPYEDSFSDDIDGRQYSRESSLDPEGSSLFFNVYEATLLPQVQPNADSEIDFRSGNPHQFTAKLKRL